MSDNVNASNYVDWPGLSRSHSVSMSDSPCILGLGGLSSGYMYTDGI